MAKHGAVATIVAALGVSVGVGTVALRDNTVRLQSKAEADRRILTTTGTAAISGVVRDADTKAPVPGAIVTLDAQHGGPLEGPQRRLTDGKGRFVFDHLEGFEAYYVTAAKSGYFDGHFGQATADPVGTRIALVSGHWFPDATVLISRQAAVEGRVVDPDGAPMVGIFVRVLARVMVAGRLQLAAGPVTTTDDRGAYRIGQLRPGDYLVHVPSVQSAVSSAGKGTGRGSESSEVLDSLMPVGDGARLRLGRYATPVVSRLGQLAVYPQTFYPGVRSIASAGWVTLSSGEERAGLDLALAPVPAFQVRGSIQGPQEAAANLTLRLLAPGTESLGDGGEVATALVDAHGAFTFAGVAAGSYTLDARRTVAQLEFKPGTNQTSSLPRPPSPLGGNYTSSDIRAAPAGTSATVRASRGSEEYWGRGAVTVVDRDVSDVLVTLQRSLTMTGRFRWDPASPPGPGYPGLVRLEPASGDVSLGMPRSIPPREDTPDFRVDGLLPGEYIFTVAGSFKIKSVTWGGREYAYRAMDARSDDLTDVVVTLTTSPTEVSGAIRDEAQSTSQAAVLIFPAESNLWANYGFSPARIRVTPVSTGRQYRVQGLPAGEYYAIAVDAGTAERWRDPAALAQFARVATRWSVAWGGAINVNLAMARLRQ